jgi:hypothetical protein
VSKLFRRDLTVTRLQSRREVRTESLTRDRVSNWRRRGLRRAGHRGKGRPAAADIYTTAASFQPIRQSLPQIEAKPVDEHHAAIVLCLNSRLRTSSWQRRSLDRRLKRPRGVF